MTQADLLLRAVLIDPSDEVARLAWADALEDEGQSERAQFIRRSVREGPVEGMAHRWNGQWWTQPVFTSRYLTPDLESWLLGGLPRWEGVTVIERRGLIEEVRCYLTCWLRHGQEICERSPVTRLELTDRCARRVRRGWVWRSGPKVEVYQTRGCDLIGQFAPCDLLGGGSAGLHNVAFPTAVAAAAALSRACLDWARGKAGLPSLGLTPKCAPPTGANP